MTTLFSNNAATVLAAPVSTGQVQISVIDASKFPAVSPQNPCYITLQQAPPDPNNPPANPTIEICLCTAKVGNTLNVTRARDGTVARTFIAGDYVEARITRAILDDFIQTEEFDTALADKADAAALAGHEADFNNPHEVTAAQVGADPSGSAASVQSNLDDHVADDQNPHLVTAAQTGAEPALGNPASNGQVLASTTAGVRSWVTVGGGSEGEANTTSNEGTGTGLALPKAGINLPFKTLLPQSSIVTITDGAQEVSIGVDESVIVHQNLNGAGTYTHPELDSHVDATDNPHLVTTAQIGAASETDLNDHIADTNNPHSVTTAVIGAEDALGDPPVDGYVLSSTVAGVRSWISPSAVGGAVVTNPAPGVNQTITPGSANDIPLTLIGRGLQISNPDIPDATLIDVLAGQVMTGSQDYMRVEAPEITPTELRRFRLDQDMSIKMGDYESGLGVSIRSFDGVINSRNPSYARIGMNNASASVGKVDVQLQQPNQIGFTSRGAASQSANLYEAKDSAGGLLWSVGPTGAMQISSTDPAVIPLNIQPPAGQTANYFAVLDEAGMYRLRATSANVGIRSTGRVTADVGGSLLCVSPIADYNGIAVRGDENNTTGQLINLRGGAGDLAQLIACRTSNNSIASAVLGDGSFATGNYAQGGVTGFRAQPSGPTVITGQIRVTEANTNGLLSLNPHDQQIGLHLRADAGQTQPYVQIRDADNAITNEIRADGSYRAGEYASGGGTGIRLFTDGVGEFTSAGRVGTVAALGCIRVSPAANTLGIQVRGATNQAESYIDCSAANGASVMRVIPANHELRMVSSGVPANYGSILGDMGTVSGAAGLFLYRAAEVGNSYALFRNGASNVAYVSQTGNVASTGNVTILSDRTSKSTVEIVIPNQVDIDAIIPRRFKRNGSSRWEFGFVAQELQAIVPEAVVPWIDSEDGTPGDRLGIQEGQLIAVLVAELQALRARVAELENT